MKAIPAPQTDDRGVAPVVGELLLVAIVVVLGATLSVGALAVGEQMTEPGPAVAVDTEQTGDSIAVTHQAGGTIASENLHVKGGTIVESSADDELRAGDRVTVSPESDADEVVVVWENERQSATLASIPVEDRDTTDSSLLAQTDADAVVPVNEYGQSSEEQYEALENVELTDPFTLAVRAPSLAGENSTDYAVTAYYGDFGEAPNDRLSGPSTPLVFDERFQNDCSSGIPKPPDRQKMRLIENNSRHSDMLNYAKKTRNAVLPQLSW